MRDRCTCQPGRDIDGSEFGPSEYCESQPVNDEAPHWYFGNRLNRLNERRKARTAVETGSVGIFALRESEPKSVSGEGGR